MREGWPRAVLAGITAVAVPACSSLRTVSAGSVIPTPIGDDPYTDGGSGHQHKTQLEPDSFASGRQRLTSASFDITLPPRALG